MGKVSDDKVGSAARSWHAHARPGMQRPSPTQGAAENNAVSIHAVSNLEPALMHDEQQAAASPKSWNCMCWWKLLRPRRGSKALMSSHRPQKKLCSSSHQDLQAAAALASEAMRSIVAILSEVTATSAVAVSPDLQYPISESLSRSRMYGMKATDSAHFIVVARLCDLVSADEGVDSDALW